MSNQNRQIPEPAVSSRNRPLPSLKRFQRREGVGHDAPRSFYRSRILLSPSCSLTLAVPDTFWRSAHGIRSRLLVLLSPAWIVAAPRAPWDDPANARFHRDACCSTCGRRSGQVRVGGDCHWGCLRPLRWHDRRRRPVVPVEVLMHVARRYAVERSPFSDF